MLMTPTLVRLTIRTYIRHIKAYGDKNPRVANCLRKEIGRLWGKR